MDPALHADLRRPEGDRLADPFGELARVDLVGVGRASGLPEAAERAADRADVREVDVAVDDERRHLAAELRAQAIGPGANLLDRLGPLLAEQRDELGARKLMAVGGPLHRPRREVSVADRGCGAIAVAGGHRFPARHERRETVRDRPEHRRLHPFPVHVLRIDAEPLGERVAERAQALADLQWTRERMLGGNVIAVGREAAEVGRPRLDEVDPPIGEVRRHLDADVGHHPPALGDEALHVVERDR